WLDEGRLCLSNVPPRVALGWPNHQVSRILEHYQPAGGWRVLGVDLGDTAVAHFLRGRGWRPWVVEAYSGRSAAIERLLHLAPEPPPPRASPPPPRGRRAPCASFSPAPGPRYPPPTARRWWSRSCGRPTR